MIVEEAADGVAVRAAVEDGERRKVPSTRRSDQAEHEEGMIARSAQSTLLAALALAVIEEDEDWEKMVIVYCF